MAHAISLDYHASAAHAGAGILARVRKGLSDYRLYRATIAELSALSERELSDLGIHRSMIRSIARQAIYGA